MCARCGWGLGARPAELVSLEGGDARRRLWYARQGEALVHGADVVGFLGLALSSRSLARAREEAIGALLELVSQRDDLVALRAPVSAWARSWGVVSIEELLSVLWRARWPVAGLFPSRVRRVLG